MQKDVFSNAQNQERKYIINCACAAHFDITPTEYNELLPSISFSDTVIEEKKSQTNSLFGSKSTKVLEIFAPKTARGENKQDFSALVTPKSARNHDRKFNFQCDELQKIDEQEEIMKQKTIQLFKFGTIEKQYTPPPKQALQTQGTAQVALFDEQLSVSDSSSDLAPMENFMKQPIKVQQLKLIIPNFESVQKFKPVQQEFNSSIETLHEVEDEINIKDEIVSVRKTQKEVANVLSQLVFKKGQVKQLSPLQMRIKNRNIIKK